MEYRASGRCVLATRTLEYEAHPELVIIANNREEYLQRFSEIVADPSPWNSDELTAKRKNFANQNTYPRQLDRIQEALGVRGRVLANRKAT
jgi:hypothetical protein